MEFCFMYSLNHVMLNEMKETNSLSKVCLPFLNYLQDVNGDVALKKIIVLLLVYSFSFNLLNEYSEKQNNYVQKGIRTK
jgi:hypothetical protein